MFKPPLPHDEAAETASFRKAFASAMQKADPVCSPPAAKTESIQGLAALVDSGQAGGIPQRPPVKTKPSLSLQLTNPAGFWYRVHVNCRRKPVLKVGVGSVAAREARRS